MGAESAAAGDAATQLHRSLQAAHIVLDDQWRPVLLEFGVPVAEPAEAAGKHSAPEQVCGSACLLSESVC
jgi:hypothetical protein